MKRNKNKARVKLLSVMVCACLMTACSANAVDEASDTTAGSGTASRGAESVAAEAASIPEAASIDLSEAAAFDEEDRNAEWDASKASTIALNGESAVINGQGASVESGIVTISEPGTYVLSGQLANGQVVVDAATEGTARLVLNGAELHNEAGPALYVKEADRVVVTLAEGTSSVISDGKVYAVQGNEDEPNAALFSMADLTINGTGKLTVRGNYNNGITSRDDLKIVSGMIDVTAMDDGIMGRDLIAVESGTIIVQAGGDGMKSTNDADADKGMVALAGGTYAITSGGDGIEAAASLLIGGGSFEIHAGDDGLHADATLQIAGGDVLITESYEGIEGGSIVISGGQVRLKASDDGVNVAGGKDGTAKEQAAFADSASRMLSITGGTLVVDAAGDGLDANGSIAMSGGTVVVHGPIENGNGALDYDGEFVMNGGVLVAAGSAGMAQAPSEASAQRSILMSFAQPVAAGTTVHLADSEGKAVASFTPRKDYQTVVISSPAIAEGGSYTLYTGGKASGEELAEGLYGEGSAYEGGTKVVAFELASVTTWLNESGVTEARSGMPGPGGRMGGGRPSREGGPGGRMAPGDVPSGDVPPGEMPGDTASMGEAPGGGTGEAPAGAQE